MIIVEIAGLAAGHAGARGPSLCWLLIFLKKEPKDRKPHPEHIGHWSTNIPSPRPNLALGEWDDGLNPPDKSLSVSHGGPAETKGHGCTLATGIKTSGNRAIPRPQQTCEKARGADLRVDQPTAGNHLIRPTLGGDAIRGARRNPRRRGRRCGGGTTQTEPTHERDWTWPPGLSPSWSSDGSAARIYLTVYFAEVRIRGRAATGEGFLSGHAGIAAVLATAAMRRYPKLRLPLAGLVATVGVSLDLRRRGTACCDVVGGAALGLTFAAKNTP